MKSWIYKLALRRGGDRATQPAEESPPAAQREGGARRAFWFRRGLLFALVSIGATSFIEVVLLPGKLVRQRFSQAGAAASADVDGLADSNALTPELLFTSDATRESQAKIRRGRAESRLRDAHAKLESSIALTQVQLQQSRSSFTATLRLPPDPASAAIPRLGAILAAEPTAQVAWQDLLKRWAEADQSIADGTALAHLAAGRFADNSFLDDDDKEMRTVMQRLKSAAVRLKQAQMDTDHLNTLLAARAALARPNLVQQTSGEIP